MNLLHLGDIHPRNDGTIAGKVIVDPATGQNQTLTDLTQSLDFVRRYATSADTRCAFALLTGDLFDSPRPHANEVRILMRFVLALADDLQVLIIAGNHDSSQNPLDATALECFQGLRNVTVFDRPTMRGMFHNGEPVRFGFLPYPTKGRILTQDAGKDASPEEVTAKINAGLTDILRSFQVHLDPMIPSVLLAHGSVATAKIGEQPRSLAYDIQIPLDECGAFTYVALGHIHQPQQVAPNAWYSGSLMRQSFGEEHEQKGFNLVTLAAGQPARVTFIKNPHARRYQTLRPVPIGQKIMDDEDMPDPTVVWRFKGQLTPEEYDQMRPPLQDLAPTVPHFQPDVELRTEARARDAGMATCLTMDEALRRALADMSADDQDALLAKHHALLQEVDA